MKYVPMNENELLEVPCKINIAEVELETTFLALPICGKNELLLLSVTSDNNIKTTRLEMCNKIFDLFCKGYIVDGERIMFKDDQKPSSYFSYFFTSWFYDNLYAFNSLSIDQKKS